MSSPFLQIDPDDWLAANELAFAVPDGFPVSPGHSLVVTRRLVPTFFDATPEEQAALMQLVADVRLLLDDTLNPKPNGYNIGFNSGDAAGQTVPHVHIHVIPRYHGDVPDPRGGVRFVIPDKANYLTPTNPSTSNTTENRHTDTPSLSLTTGVPTAPLWEQLAVRIQGATSVDILVSFVQLSGLNLIAKPLFNALQLGTKVRILVSDYLGISDPAALKRLLHWIHLCHDQSGIPQDTHDGDEQPMQLDARLILTDTLPGAPASFHPKAWSIQDSSGSSLVVGSSNLSHAALQSGIEWNLIVDSSTTAEPVQVQARAAFEEFWNLAAPLSNTLIEDYQSRIPARPIAPKETALPSTVGVQPRDWQRLALQKLQAMRADGCQRAIVAVATGMGKTWLAAFDIAQLGTTLDRRPRVLLIAHRRHILTQAELAVAQILDHQFGAAESSWFIGSDRDLKGELVVASIQKLSRREGLAALSGEQFDYVLIDEVHHAQAPSYRRVLATLNANFILGLTATPERADGLDVISLFDDHLAWQATIGDGIREDVLVPFHYVGIRDTVDFGQIPWRNGRFDLEELETRVSRSERMDRLWDSLQQHPAERSIVFCCSRRHALFTRDWLRDHGLSAAAVFSGDGGDSYGSSLKNLRNGRLQFLCVVDMFNEGLDIPAVDRVIMLRPTDSRVVFLQQLGRGLRISEGKTRLLVIDFVGNHRVFAQRLMHLLALNGSSASFQSLKDWLSGGPAPLPAGCLLDVELEAKDLLTQFLPTGKAAAIEGYRRLRDDLQRRPSLIELESSGYLPSTISSGHDSWFHFVAEEGDLSPAEVQALDQHADWLKMLQSTAMTKSAKMVTLRVLLDAGHLFESMPLNTLSLAARRFVSQHDLLRHDYQNNELHTDRSSDDDWIKWWVRWPIERWFSPQQGQSWFRRTDDSFQFTGTVDLRLQQTLLDLSADLIDWRLARYQRRLAQVSSSDNVQFQAKLSHAGERVILFVPDVKQSPGRPTGPTDVKLPDGSVWTFKFVKLACNVAMPKGERQNQLSSLLRLWYGDDAGVPGTNFLLQFSKTDAGWVCQPLNVPTPRALTNHETDPMPYGASMPTLLPDIPPAKQYAPYVPVYDLVAAAGGWGPEGSPEILGWTEVTDAPVKPGMFLAQVHGKSMEPEVPSGSWCLFRPCPTGSRQGRRLLVQLSTSASPDDGGRYTLKKYHSEKTRSADGWEHQSIELQPLNSSFPTIVLDATDPDSLRIVGELVTIL